MDQELCFRTATIGDKAEVTGIMTAFEGRDYLADTYEYLIQQPNFIGVVAEDKTHREMVAFCGAYIINAGKTMFTIGSRVRESFQGKGVYKKLLGYLEEKVAETSPTVENEEITINSLNRLLSVPEDKRKYTELFRKPLKYYTKQGFGPKSNRTAHNDNVKELGSDVCREIFKDPKLSASLFPIRIVLDWYIYRPIVENADFISSRERYITGCTGADGKIKSLVFGAWFQCRDFFAYAVDIYGSMSADILAGHLDRHVEKGTSLSYREVRFLVTTDSSTMGMMDDVCLSLGLKSADFYSTHCIVLARKLGRSDF